MGVKQNRVTARQGYDHNVLYETVKSKLGKKNGILYVQENRQRKCLKENHLTPSRLVCFSPLFLTHVLINVHSLLPRCDSPCQLLDQSANNFFLYGGIISIRVPSAVTFIYLVCFLPHVCLSLFQLCFAQ